MSIRRLFWLGAAVLFSVAAVIAIAAVLGSGLGQTQERILETCGIVFVCGAATLAGFACLDRGVIRPVARVAIAVGLASLLGWTSAVWRNEPSDTYWKVVGLLGIWAFAALVITTLRLLASSPRLLGTVVPAAWASAVIATAVGSEMVLNEDSGPWKLMVVLVILTALGYALIPALQRFWGAGEARPAAERLLGTVGSIEVFAVRGAGRSVTIGSSCTRLAASEGIVLRERLPGRVVTP
jgi:hypothetical protein